MSDQDKRDDLEMIDMTEDKGNTQEETEEKVKSMQRNLQHRNNQKMQKEYQLRTLTEPGEEYSRQIRERQVMMQYLELNDTYLWNDG